MYIINALYLWPITVWTYLEYGRPDLPNPASNNKDRLEANEQDPLLHSHPAAHDGPESSTRANSLPPSASHAGHSGNDVNHDHKRHGTEHGDAAQQVGKPHHMNADRPLFATITIATCHCGAGCVLGDIIGEWLVYSSGARIGGSMLYASFVVGKLSSSLGYPFGKLTQRLTCVVRFHTCSDIWCYFPVLLYRSDGWRLRMEDDQPRCQGRYLITDFLRDWPFRVDGCFRSFDLSSEAAYEYCDILVYDASTLVRLQSVSVNWVETRY